ncbi:MAG: DUF4037 domain-containing protein, partial [Clostridiales bacterium]|nr:DUF4037 domain-containing protein [Clostridiales bacterium]
YDDNQSQDHDFGPSFCLWLTRDDFEHYGKELQRAYRMLPQTFMGFPARQTTPQGGGRVGVSSIPMFYRKFTGQEAGPAATSHWMAVPEHFLAQAVNGKVFQDPLGEFSSIRDNLLSFYPEQVLWKKLAARSVTMAQAGQYNYPRSLKREDTGAAFFALREFVFAFLSMAHLLNHRYMPYYKWAFRSFGDLPRLSEYETTLKQMIQSPLDRENISRIERICNSVLEEWHVQKLTDLNDDFLEPIGWSLYQRITDPELTNRHILDG